MRQLKKDVAELKLELHKMHTLGFDLTTLLPVEGEQVTGTSNVPDLDLDFRNLLSAKKAHGTDISQAPGSVTHTNDHLDEVSGESREETYEE